MNESSENILIDSEDRAWCHRDKHYLFERFRDFNDWIDQDESVEAIEIREEYNIQKFPHPSRAFFAGDKKAYEQAFSKYKTMRRNLALNGRYIIDQFGDDHWLERNLFRFDQLTKCLKMGSIVPFIGAGISVDGGYPTWKDHLRQQGKTAGIASEEIESLIGKGQFEEVIKRIEEVRGRDVFIQEIRDVFSKTGNIAEVTLRITEIFSNTLITTNYDQLIEQGCSTGGGKKIQLINGLEALDDADPACITIIKLHGDINNPRKCILSKSQYDNSYGQPSLDLKLPIPKLLSYYYKNSSLLFLGCSLNNDRTVEVFRAVKNSMGDENRPPHFSIEQAPEDIEELRKRNAHLAQLGISAIWFEKDRFEYVEDILRLAQNELRYQEA